MTSVVRWRSSAPLYLRVWRGDFELPIAFFVIGVGGLTALGLLAMAFEMAGAATEDHWLRWATLIPHVAREVVTSLVALMILHCVWRSAGRFKGHLVWSRMARAIIATSAIGLSIPTIGVLINLATPQASLTPWTDSIHTALHQPSVRAEQEASVPAAQLDDASVEPESLALPESAPSPSSQPTSPARKPLPRPATVAGSGQREAWTSSFFERR